jgi:hypothetical protein
MIRHALTEIGKHWNEPRWWYVRFNARVVGPILGAIHRQDRTNVMREDWDNLAILDACRADVFEEVVDVEDFESYRRIHSLGSSSPDWMRNTFAGEHYPDVVYVTANPWIVREAPDSFFEIVNLWETDRGMESEDFRDVYGLEEAGVDGSPSIPAERVTEAAIAANETYPDKRIIAHYFQPHPPQMGRRDGSRLDAPRSDMDREHYVENLLYALTHAREMAQTVGGKTAYTADHGELMGERLWPFPHREWGHATGIAHPKLTEVPFATETIGERREVTAGEVSAYDADLESVNETLENLGYRV